MVYSGNAPKIRTGDPVKYTSGCLYWAVGCSPSGSNKERTCLVRGDQIGNVVSGTARTTYVLCHCGRCCVF